MKGQPSSAESIVEEAIWLLVAEVSRQLAEAKAGDRSLVQGWLGESLLILADSKSIGLMDLWRGMRATFTSHDSLHVLEYYLWERTGTVSHSLNVTEEAWRALIAGCTQQQVKREIRRLADWQETFIAAAGYAIYKENKACFDRDTLKKMIHNAVYEAKFWTEQDELKPRTVEPWDDLTTKDRYRGRLDFIEGSVNKPFMDGHPETARAWLMGDKKDWRHERFDKWLFCIWPLVLHGEWTYDEIVTVTQRRFPQFSKCYPGGDAQDLRKHCRTQIGLRHCVSQGRPQHRALIPGEAVAMGMKFSWDEASEAAFADKILKEK